MAKKSKIARNEQRKVVVERYAAIVPIPARTPAEARPPGTARCGARRVTCTCT